MDENEDPDELNAFFTDKHRTKYNYKIFKADSINKAWAEQHSTKKKEKEK